MSPARAIMPMHLHLAAIIAADHSSESVSSVKSVVKQSNRTHCKYVVIKDPRGVKHVILFSSTLNHAEAVPCLCKPISAGYVMIYSGQIVIPEINSMTLNLGPAKGDKQLLSQLLNQ